ncbi:hypothetical protein MLD38_000045 [Melastoma candidum]|uniref:Uncharacterized protein n=1 Tax=Melastoma candidum TaxID=119954 RepID=A0ACB9S996_9MYRT|nr:hypothetical protein MLD38_000045 [Melastoma candidum]
MSRKDYLEGRQANLLKLVQVLSFLVGFTAGVILGLLTSTHMSAHCPILLLQLPWRPSCILKNLSHGITDDEIMWRVSLVPRKVEFPFKRVPKVAFMFLMRGPLPMLPLWEKFFEGQDKNLHSVYIHSYGYDVKLLNESAFYGRHIPCQIVQWGSVKPVDAERRLLANALLDQSNERFVLL